MRARQDPLFRRPPLQRGRRSGSGGPFAAPRGLRRPLVTTQSREGREHIPGAGASRVRVESISLERAIVICKHWDHPNRPLHARQGGPRLENESSRPIRTAFDRTEVPSQGRFWDSRRDLISQIKSNEMKSNEIKSFEKCTRSQRPMKRNPNRMRGTSEAAWDFDLASRGKMAILAGICRKQGLVLPNPFARLSFGVMRWLDKVLTVNYTVSVKNWRENWLDK
eukprot:1180892-Prorocentrum_minimum.AAC.1